MAIDYSSDLDALYASSVVGDPEYDAVALTQRNQLSEQRILTTIEILRAHIAELRDPSEARLLHYCLSRMLAAIPMSGYIASRLAPQATGTVSAPTFSANAAINVTVGGTTADVLFEAGGNDLAAAIVAINADLAADNVDEVEAFNDGGFLGFRNTDGNEGVSFTLATGTAVGVAAQIATEAGITLGTYSGGTAQVSAAAVARDDALAHFVRAGRPAAL